MIFLISGMIFLTVLICLTASTSETGNDLTSDLMIAFEIGLYLGVVPVFGDNSLALLLDNVESTENTELLTDLTDDALDEATDLGDALEATERLAIFPDLGTTGDLTDDTLDEATDLGDALEATERLAIFPDLGTTGDLTDDTLDEATDLGDALEATERLALFPDLRTTGDLTDDTLDEATERLALFPVVRTTGVDTFLTTRLIFLNTGDPARLVSFIALRNRGDTFLTTI
jgi:hypothetical protein